MWRICSTNGWWSAFGKKRGKNGKKPWPPVHDGLVNRDFTADASHQLWLAEITEHRTGEGRLCLCAVKDVFSNRIVGYWISDRMKPRLAVEALDNAVTRRGDACGCVPPTGQELQFRSRTFVHALDRHDMVGSMGKVGAAGNKTAMESYFALLQQYAPDRGQWATRDELRAGIITWTERAYHLRRGHAALGRLTPSSTRPS